MINNILKRTVLLFVIFFFFLNKVKAVKKDYFDGQVTLYCLDDYMKIWIDESYANSLETEGTPFLLELKKSPEAKKPYDENCEVWKGSDGWYKLEVNMTPGKHECVANYLKIAAGTLYQFEAGFKIRMPHNRVTREKAPKTIKFACLQTKEISIPDVTIYNTEEIIGFQIEDTGTYETHLHIYHDPDHIYEHGGSIPGEIPLNDGKVYVKYHTPADKDLELHNCRIALDEDFTGEVIELFKYHCPLTKYRGTTRPENIKLEEGGTSATFSFDAEDFHLEGNPQTGFLKCDVLMVERGEPTYSANVANCGQRGKE